MSADRQIEEIVAANALKVWREKALLPDFLPGWVWLVGAGPGDPGLLTLHALNALAQADVVLYDALVDKAVLDFARPGARLEYAGKRGGRVSQRQTEISKRLISHARKGRRVLRLKGGDPYVFGRGAEEALALAAAGIPFQVTPGISAGIGGLAQAGIPLTHRDFNQTVTFITGHDARGMLPQTIDWKALADGSPAIVVYMGMKHRAEIARHLIEAGRNPNEPAAIVADATAKTQRVIETDLAGLGVHPDADEIKGPAIIVIGEIVRLRGQLNWQDALGGAKLTPGAQEFRGVRHC
jgi:uroporphyrin-III C-methyltransferase